MSEMDIRQVIKINEIQKRENEKAYKLSNVRRKLEDIIENIDVIAERKYTGWHVLLKNIDNKWVCLGVVNPDTTPENEIPEEWDLCMPIPDPATIPEFQGF